MKETVDIITSVISTLGFPIFVAVWLLWRTDKLLRRLTDAIVSLEKICGKDLIPR